VFQAGGSLLSSASFQSTAKMMHELFPMQRPKEAAAFKRKQELVAATKRGGAAVRTPEKEAVAAAEEVVPAAAKEVVPAAKEVVAAEEYANSAA
jgi:hypothetical protein